MNVPRIEDLARFMRERHNIYLKRRNGWPGPWTDDAILRDGRFCNIFRELDTVTQWIDTNIRKPYAEHEHLWFMLCIARYINWPPTLDYLMRWTGAWPSHANFRPEEITLALQRLASTGTVKVYTGAYMIRAESDPTKPWYSWSKHRYIAEIVLGRLWEDREKWKELLEPDTSGYRDDISAATALQPSLRDVWEEFQQPRYIGWGPFMAYEVVTDLRHTRYLRNAPDIHTWANAGPGAIRGLNRMFGREVNAQPPKVQTNLEMLGSMDWLNGDAALWPAKWPRLEMRDVEHSLCEFDKYERVRLGEGKMRSKYDWKKASNLAKR